MFSAQLLFTIIYIYILDSSVKNFTAQAPINTHSDELRILMTPKYMRTLLIHIYIYSIHTSVERHDPERTRGRQRPFLLPF